MKFYYWIPIRSVLIIFNRSEAERGVRYTQFLGDGDSKALNAMCQSKPYSVPINKLVCSSCEKDNG